MKRSLIMLLMLFFISSCNKGDNDVPDFRDKYVGVYQCHKTGFYYCEDSTYYDTIEMVTISKNSDSLINILDATYSINFQFKACWKVSL